MILAYSEEEHLPLRQLLASRELLLLAGEERWNKILLNYLAEQQIKPRIRTIRGGPALCVNLLRSKTMTFMPKSFFDTLSGPKPVSYTHLDVYKRQPWWRPPWRPPRPPLTSASTPRWPC